MAKKNRKNGTPIKKTGGPRPPENLPSNNSGTGGSAHSGPASNPLTPIRDGSPGRHDERSIRSRRSERSVHTSERLRANLEEFAEDTQVQYDTLADELARAQAKQDRLNRAFERLRTRQAAQRAQFAREAERAQADLARSGYPAGESASQARAPPRSRAPDDDGVTYADPDDIIERGQNNLFRSRDDDETSSNYANRVNAQTRFLAQEHYREGVAKRNARAEQWWRERTGGWEDQEIKSESPSQPRCDHGGHGPPKDSSDSSSSSSSHDGRGGRGPPRSNRTRDSSGSRGQSRGRQHGAGGGPPDDNSSSSDNNNNNNPCP